MVEKVNRIHCCTRMKEMQLDGGSISELRSPIIVVCICLRYAPRTCSFNQRLDESLRNRYRTSLKPSILRIQDTEDTHWLALVHVVTSRWFIYRFVTYDDKWRF